MARILLVTQDKGGVGKSLISRALAEAAPEAPVIEVDASRRLVELEDRVTFFPMRADRAAIEKSGGRAARAEFDGLITGMTQASLPTIVDVGANTSGSLLALLAELAPDLKAAGVEIGIVVIATAEAGALAEAPRLMQLAKPFASARFLIENRLRGEVDGKVIGKIADGAAVTALAEHVMEEQAVALYQAGGLASIPRLDAGKLNDKHGLALGSRIRRDLARFRLEAMEAVRPAAEWLVG
ncbi:MAG: hypothetical protein C0458_25790 [Methylobacterium sp.]|jgi:hypothetical protein|uniref:hypothetical protein n=1 Tax=Methylobacterium sp. CCH7-A2 TaxID=1768789 RepID=UPI00082F033D|nr:MULTISPECIES: hypothetical protein [Hyphomicrobiales]MBA4224156.1 hypothetical protein [Methylobacterium sp.]